MSYQPPGPYPAYPQQGGFGPAPKPPIPQSVQRAFTLMLVGAGLEVVNVIVSFLFQDQIQHKIENAFNAGSTTTTTGNLGSTAFGGIIGVGLWIWMAYANRAGKNWARITATVFFGISCLALLADVAAFSLIGKWLGSLVVIYVVLALVGWLVGLFTVIQLWSKSSGPYFKPEQYMAYPTPPYTYPIMPGQPMQPQDGAPQQPTDPWATPPSN